jgi:hypothetical protein
VNQLPKGGSGADVIGNQGVHGIALGGPVAIWEAVSKVAQSDGAKEAVRFLWESREGFS